MLVLTNTQVASLTPEQRLLKAATAIANHPEYTAMAGVLMIGTKSIRDDIPTACTDGRDEYYGREFVEQMNDPELRFIMLHEAFHKMIQHLSIYKYLWDIDADLANKACDYVINGKIIRAHKRDGFATMTGPLKIGCYDPKYDDSWTEAQVFEDLRKKQQQQQQQQGQGQSGGQGDEQGDEQGQGQSGGQGGGKPLDDHDWEGAQSLSDEEKNDLTKQIDEALRQGAMAASKTGGKVSRDIEELLSPQVDWRDALRQFVSTTCAGHDHGTWARPNRRFMGAGVYMPSPISEQVEELLLAIDTSGSIGREDLTMFLSEVQGICETVTPRRIRILYWGHEVAGDETYEEHDLDSLAKSTKPAGGGGTEVNCVTEYIRAHGLNPQAVVVLTDGYLAGDWGQWSSPVLWCVLGNKTARPDVGQTVHIKRSRVSC